MTAEAQNILRSFDSLQEIDKREVAYEIIHRSLALDMPALSDEQLTAVADDIFFELDKEEGRDA
jgi:hypothetical protein